jgi:mycothiol synthase
MSITVSPLHPPDLPAVARLMFAAAPAADRQTRADRFAELVTSGEIDAAGMLVAKRGSAILGSCVVQLMPGGSAVVTPPGTPAADALAAATVEHLARSSAVIAHLFLGPSELAQADPLLAHGFRPAATITHMLRDLEHLPPPPLGLTFVPSAFDPARFGDTLLATYDGSLDVPEANTDRTAEQILDGYRPGQPDPPHWWYAVDSAGTAVGVVLLIPPRFAPTWELGYLGVVPAARGKGHGTRLVRFALHVCDDLGAKHLTLSVDTRNEPALAVYRTHGFRSYHEQRVFLWRRDW